MYYTEDNSSMLTVEYLLWPGGAPTYAEIDLTAAAADAKNDSAADDATASPPILPPCPLADGCCIVCEWRFLQIVTRVFFATTATLAFLTTQSTTCPTLCSKHGPIGCQDIWSLSTLGFYQGQRAKRRRWRSFHCS